VNDETRVMMVDGHALVHRAFHALPEDLSTSTGEPTNAVLGFTNIVLKEITELKPTHILMAMDRPVPTFRHEKFAAYKATRPATPHPLRVQFQRVREVADALNMTIYELDGYEADDVLGTLAGEADRQGFATVIVTGDLDALQLVSERVHVLTPGRGVSDTTEYDVEAVRARYGINPQQLPDWKALVGDTSDNIPGVRGVGNKTASKLVAQYANLEGIYEHLGELPAKQRELLQAGEEQAYESRELATIVRDAPVELDLEQAQYTGGDHARLIELFRELEFYGLIDRLQGTMPRRPAPVPARPARAGDPEQLGMFGDEADGDVPSAGNGDGRLISTDSLPGLFAETVRDLQSGTETRVVRNLDDLDVLVGELSEVDTFAFDTETTSTDPLRAKLVGLSFATVHRKGWYVPVGHAEGEQLELDLVLKRLRPLLTDPHHGKVGHNLKYDYAVMASYGIAVGGLVFDTMVAAYLANATGRNLSLSALALQKLHLEMIPIEALIGKGKAQITMDQVDIDTVGTYAGEDAAVSLELKGVLQRELQENNLTELFNEVEMPLVRVLADMELIGVKLDTSVLERMSKEMGETIARLESRIYELAGRRFNINSTQQLGQLLFVELKLPSGRRTKTGYSTDNEVLEGLRGKHEIVDQILEYRQLIKLRNTYVDALPTLINPESGRVHTDFNQCVAATGRLSSSNPNLQNIPIRGDVGRRIRRSFIPLEKDHVLLAADYSQIELRILASMSHDPRLMESFLSGEDVHRATASAVFGVPLSEVTPDQRRIAKVVNFGIIYGIGESRLAYETGITRMEAAEFIANYNRTYAGVKAFMDDMRKRAALHGYVSTLLNRRRYIPEIHSTNPGIRTAAERAAINMPIQGTAADAIKIAMIRLDAELRKHFPDAHMVLQVHDELVFDVPVELVPEVSARVQDIMEHALPLEVPLEVEMKLGEDWYDMAPLERVA
jgi:DNA polymerase I